MALVVFSSLVSNMVGRSGGSVWQRVKGGTILRRQGAQLSNAKSNLNLVRSNIVTLQQAWQNLYTQDRNLWEVYAQFRNRPSRKAITGPLGGQATFILENSVRMQFVQAFGTLSPTILSTPMITTPPQAVNVTSASNGGFDLTINTDYSLPDATKFFFMYISAPLLNSQFSVWNKTKLIPNISGTGSSFNIASTYTDKFSVLPQIGQYINTEIFLYDISINTFGAGTKARTVIT